MIRIEANGVTTLLLGRQGENLASRVVFDVSGWIEEYGPGTAELIFQRNWRDTPYPVLTERDGSKIVWSVTATDTAYSGNNGKCELRYYVGDVLVKSQVWATHVTPAISTPAAEEPPSPEHGWVDQVVAAGAEAKLAGAEAKLAGAEAKESADRAESAMGKGPQVKNGTWWIYDAQNQVYVDTGVKAEAKDGYAPQKGVDYFDGAPGKDGRDGVDGAPGKDGYTPVKGVDYFDGAPGKDGAPGSPGRDGSDGAPGRDGRDGVDGRDGYTPVRGTDYWTEADVAEIKAYVDQQLGVIENGSY